MPSHNLITLTAKSVERSRSFESAIITPPSLSLLYYSINSLVFQVKYSAYAECEIIHFVNCEIFCFAKCEIKFVPSHAAGVFHCRRQFHTRPRISLVPQERISLKKAIRLREWLFSWHTLTKSIHTASFFEIDPWFLVGGQTYPQACMGAKSCPRSFGLLFHACNESM